MQLQCNSGGVCCTLEPFVGIHRSLVKHAKRMRCLACAIILWRLVKRLSLASGLMLNTTSGFFSFINPDIPFLLLKPVWFSLSISLSLTHRHTHTHTHTRAYTHTVLPFPMVIEKEHWVEAGKRRIILSYCNMTG